MKLLLLMTTINYGILEINGSILTPFLVRMNSLLSGKTHSEEFHHSPLRRQSNEIVSEEYDFIVVGSGSAGSVIANRLSENPEWRILLLEAGNRPNSLTDIPLLAPVFQVTPYNWGYHMERQEGFCNAMEDGVCAWPRGRALGGTSVINYMIYTRGNPGDFERWEGDGNPGWSYKDVIPYYLKSEDCHMGKACQSRYHKHGGYLSIEYPFTTELTEAFMIAGEEMGSKRVDYNTPDFMGFSKIQATMKRGRRHSVATAFLDPITDRRNLRIVTSARVTKISIDHVTRTAKGVDYYKAKRRYFVTATKEVILSAGTFHSPQLLMLSGVGPKRHLEEVGISVIQDLPVGETLYDHISYLAYIFTVNETIIPRTKAIDPLEWREWLRNGKGFPSSLGGIEAIAYIKTEMSLEEADYPDIELLLAGIGSLQFDLGMVSRPELRVRKDVYDEYFRPLEGKPCYSILPILLHPKSKGYLKLKSADPFEPPLLYGNFFTDEDDHDLKTMISAIRYIQRLSRTEAFRRFGATQYERSIPGCENSIFDSDQYWECALRSLAVTVHHQISTCRMGAKSDALAVVDARMRVHGIERLRVADSSIIPVSMSAHSNAPAIMIGERMADILKEDWTR